MKKILQNIPGWLYFTVWLGIVVFVATPLGTSIWRILLSLFGLALLVRFIGEVVSKDLENRKNTDKKKKIGRNQDKLIDENEIDNVKDKENILIQNNGLNNRWHSNGQKQFEGTYKDGKLQGLSILWYSNGQKKFEGNYVDDLAEGLITEWYENGQKKIELSYVGGKPVGYHTQWHENGRKELEENFVDGNRQGLVTFWYDNGQKNFEQNYVNCKKEGLTTTWFENGQKAIEVIYKDGQPLTGSHRWYSDGSEYSPLAVEAEESKERLSLNPDHSSQ